MSATFAEQDNLSPAQSRNIDGTQVTRNFAIEDSIRLSFLVLILGINLTWVIVFATGRNARYTYAS